MLSRVVAVLALGLFSYTAVGAADALASDEEEEAAYTCQMRVWKLFDEDGFPFYWVDCAGECADSSCTKEYEDGEEFCECGDEETRANCRGYSEGTSWAALSCSTYACGGNCVKVDQSAVLGFGTSGTPLCKCLP